MKLKGNAWRHTTQTTEQDSFSLFQNSSTFKDTHESGDFGSASIQAIFLNVFFFF